MRFNLSSIPAWKLAGIIYFVLEVCDVLREIKGKVMPSVPFITAANAADLARASQAAQKLKKELKAAEKLDPVAEAEEGERHRKLRLVRVRKQQEKIDLMIAEASDAAKIDRLASAAIRLNEQERQLSNRSLPPVMKASQVKSSKSKSESFEPET